MGGDLGFDGDEALQNPGEVGNNYSNLVKLTGDTLIHLTNRKFMDEVCEVLVEFLDSLKAREVNKSIIQCLVAEQSCKGTELLYFK